MNMLSVNPVYVTSVICVIDIDINHRYVNIHPPFNILECVFLVGLIFFLLFFFFFTIKRTYTKTEQS